MNSLPSNLKQKAANRFGNNFHSEVKKNDHLRITIIHYHLLSLKRNYCLSAKPYTTDDHVKSDLRTGCE